MNSRAAATATAAVLAFLVCRGTVAQTARLGPEFRINTATVGYQERPRVAAAGSGRFVVVWETPDANLSGVAARLIDASGGFQGDEFRVNTYTMNLQGVPDVAADAGGGLVVVWQSYRQDGSYDGIYGQRLAASGSPAGGEFFVNTATLYDQLGPAVARRASGEFLVAWEGPDGLDSSIYAQRYGSTGVPAGGEFRVSPSRPGYRGYPAAGVSDGGDFVVIWESSQQDGSGYGVFGQMYRSNGNKNGQEFAVNTHTTGSQGIPSVTMRGTGEFIAVWQSPQDGSSHGIFGQRFADSGARLGTEFVVNTQTAGEQRRASIAMGPGGNFVVVWQSLLQDGSQYGIFGQRFAATGAKQGAEFRVNAYTTGPQRVPSVAMDPLDSSFLVTWDSFGQDGSATGVYGQRFRWADCPVLSATGPAPPLVCAGGTALLTATPVGGWGPIAYRWRRNGIPLTDGGDIAGATSATLKITPAGAGSVGSYACVLTDDCRPPASPGTSPVSLVLASGTPVGPVGGLTVRKAAGGASLDLGWGAAAGASDYVVFEDAAPAGHFTSQAAVSPVGATALTIPMPAGNRYYLVAGRNATCGLGPQD